MHITMRDYRTYTKRVIFVITCCIIGMFVTLQLLVDNVSATTHLSQNIKKVELGQFHSAVIAEDNSLWIWGHNDFGQIGNGTRTSPGTPQKIMDDVVDVWLYDDNSVAVKNDGTVWMWGRGENLDPITEPKKIDVSFNVIKACCNFHSIVLLDDEGCLWMDGYYPWAKEHVDNYSLVLEDVVDFKSDGDVTAAIKNDGSLWMWGYNHCGQIGNKSSDDVVNEPVKVMDDVRSVAIGYTFSAAVTNDNDLYVWGGMDAVGDIINEPQLFMNNISSVEMNYLHCAAIDLDGNLIMWGYNNQSGQIGNGEETNISPEYIAPVEVLNDVRQASVGGYHSAAITKDGTLWMWGMNSGKMITDSSDHDITNPVKKQFIYDIQTATIDGLSRKTYTGNPIDQTPNIKVCKNGLTLRQNIDYTIKHENNINAGTAIVIVTGKGDYTGTVTKTFKIIPVSLSSDEVSIPSDTRMYNEKAYQPAVAVIVSGKTLVKDKDYTVTYQNCVNAGTAKVIVEGKGNYAGTITKTFKIDPISIDPEGVSIPSATRVYYAKAYQPAPTVKVSGKTLVKNQDYTVTYQNNINVGTAKVIVKGKGNYAGTITKTFKISAATISAKGASISGGSKIYNRKAKKPQITVKVSGRTLVKGRDYTLTYRNNVNVGTGKVVVAGKGNYKGSFTKTFKINPDKIKITRAVTKKNGGKTAIDVTISRSICNPTSLQIQLAHDSGFKKQIKLSKSIRQYKSYVGSTGKLPTIQKTLAKKNHYMRIRVIKKVGNKSYYGPWSKTTVIVGR